MREAFIDPTTLEAALQGLVADGRHAAGLFPFQPLPSPQPGPVAAVDGGSAVVLETGYSTLGAWRAGWAGLETGGVPVPLVGSLRIACVSLPEPPELERVRIRQGLGVEALGALENAWPAMAPASRLNLLREADERLVALSLLPHLQGGLLLLDGAWEPGPLGVAVFDRLLEKAKVHRVMLAALSKTTAMAWRGRPLLPLLRAAAPSHPWWVPVPEDVAGREATFAVAPLAERAFRLDVANGAPDAVVARMLSTTKDLAVPGYPWPLYRVHCDIAMDPDAVADCRGRLEDALMARGQVLPTSFHEVLDVMR